MVIDLLIAVFVSAEEEDGPELPTKADEEFRPFIRRLPEFKFWYEQTFQFICILITSAFDKFSFCCQFSLLVILKYHCFSLPVSV